MTESNGRTIDDLISDHALVERAVRKATREALRRHKALGVPIAVERDGRVEWIEPEDIIVPDEME